MRLVEFFWYSKKDTMDQATWSLTRKGSTQRSIVIEAGSRCDIDWSTSHTHARGFEGVSGGGVKRLQRRMQKIRCCWPRGPRGGVQAPGCRRVRRMRRGYPHRNIKFICVDGRFRFMS